MSALPQVALQSVQSVRGAHLRPARQTDGQTIRTLTITTSLRLSGTTVAPGDGLWCSVLISRCSRRDDGQLRHGLCQRAQQPRVLGLPRRRRQALAVATHEQQQPRVQQPQPGAQPAPGQPPGAADVDGAPAQPAAGLLGQPGPEHGPGPSPAAGPRPAQLARGAPQPPRSDGAPRSAALLQQPAADLHLRPHGQRVQTGRLPRTEGRRLHHSRRHHAMSSTGLRALPQTPGRRAAHGLHQTQAARHRAPRL